MDVDGIVASDEEALGRIFHHAAAGVAVLDADGRWLRVNRYLRRMLGLSDGDGLPATLEELTHPDDRDVDRINAELMATRAVDAYRQERRLRRPDGSWLWVDSSLSAIRTGDGTVERIVAVIHEITHHKELEWRQQTLLAELAHRGRNLFAVLQSVAFHTLVADRSPSDAYEAFQGRLKALAESLGNLTDKNYAGTRLELLMGKELMSLGERVSFGGPPVMVIPAAAQTFALVLHELATNAMKYGALSTPNGTISVTWTVTGTGEAARFGFEWRETHGPPASAPSQCGFGTILTTDVAGADFDCVPQPLYEAGGFTYRFDAPIARLGALVVESPLRRKLSDPTIRALYDDWTGQRARAVSLSSFAHFDWTRYAATGAMTVGTVQPDGSVRITRVGRALVERLGRPLSESHLDAQELDGTRALYRRCVRERAPCHEHLRFDFGDGEPLAFERLVVPFSETPPGPVSHVIGIAIFAGKTNNPGGGASATDRDAASQVPLAFASTDRSAEQRRLEAP